MTKEQSIQLNNSAIDWCYQCATSNIKGCDTKRLMFVWIVLQIFRGCERNWNWHANGFIGPKDIRSKPKDCFQISIKSLKENTALTKNLYNKKYWKLLIPIVDNQLNNFGMIGINYEIEIDKGDNVIYVWFDLKEEQNEKA